MKKNVRIPNQKRSIEKKEKILDAAYNIFLTHGYYDTNTAEIARAAGLSTGSVYAYFTDKKDILLACLDKFGSDLAAQMCGAIGEISVSSDVVTVAKKVLQIFVDFHSRQKVYHDDVMSLQYRDEDIFKYFRNMEQTIMSAIVAQLQKSGLKFKHEREQTFLIFSMIRSIEDELVFNLNPKLSQEILMDECAKIIAAMLTGEGEGKQ